ncbi:hypothetical protein BC936DRAFT_146357, partial [Jimgerdemannia flammicorona]
MMWERTPFQEKAPVEFRVHAGKWGHLTDFLILPLHQQKISHIEKTRRTKLQHTAAVVKAQEAYETECTKLYEANSKADSKVAKLQGDALRAATTELEITKKNANVAVSCFYCLTCLFLGDPVLCFSSAQDQEFQRAADVLKQFTQTWNQEWREACD